MATNFAYLSQKKEFELFAVACMDAENVLCVSPVVSAVASRRALELCVKWLYAADPVLIPRERDTLQDLLHDHGFPQLMDYQLWRRLQHVVRYGNKSAHTDGGEVTKDNAILSLNIVFDFVQWVDYCYGSDFEERTFQVRAIPDASSESKSITEKYEKMLADAKNDIERIVNEKDQYINDLLSKVEQMSEQMAQLKSEHKKTRTYQYAPDMSEEETRKRYIDADLEAASYEFDQERRRNCIQREYEVEGMPNATGTGYADYVIWGDNGKIIAVVEAKKTSESVEKGKRQAKLYADCIQNMSGCRPVMFYTNGFETNIWDDLSASPTQHSVSGVFPMRDIKRRLSMRYNRKPLDSIKINEKITDRPYQMRAVTKCCEAYGKGRRKCLLVMATGTGKTRTAASLVDVLARAGFVQRVLFLADRIQLVRQAKQSFSEYIPNTPACNLLLNREERGADFVFSTYPTMLGAIDNERNSDGTRFFSPGHFDLIIVDEAHRSIFNKYRAIFEYFDACLLGLTATPKDTVDQSTYQFFDLKPGFPTDVYEYDTAVNKDKVLVPYYPIETATKLPDDGIKYADLDEGERELYEEEFAEDEDVPERIPPQYINKYIFNEDTADRMISDLMNNGIRHAGGNHVGKTILFAQTKKHAQFLIDRFETLYPEYGGKFCCKIVSGEPYAQKDYDDFKKKDSMPFIAVTVDKLETGVDIPEVVNLVFAKKVYSRIKFDQMIGRGTRLCKDLFGAGEDKTEFRIFDYMRNFQFFELHPKGKEAGAEISPVAMRFARRVEIIKLLQSATFSDEEHQKIREELVETVVGDIHALQPERIEVKLKLRYVETYKDAGQFVCLDDTKKVEIVDNLANLVRSVEDDAAISFDVVMYGLMISALSGSQLVKRQKSSVVKNATNLLDKCATIPDVKAKIPKLQELTADAYWDAMDVLKFEETRAQLRDIMKFVKHEVPRVHYTNFKDDIVYREEGRNIDFGKSDFEEYKAKVNRYVEQNRHNATIQKLLHNEPIDETDYKELERIFTEELGTRDDYEKSYRDEPFGLLIRKIAKMDRQSAMDAFGSFIATQRPNAEQIAFIEKVVDYLVENGCVNNVRDLLHAPFDRPFKFSVLFTRDEQMQIVQIVNKVKENALVV